MNAGGSAGSSGDQPKIDGFDDFRVLGRGGFSTVWRARQPAYDREVAVKVLDAGIDDENGRRRFQRECATTGRVSGHPNIVTLLGSGFLPDGRPYLAMDLCERGSLADKLRDSGPAPAADVTRIGIKVAGALHAAHQRGVLHRDIKPENILVTSYGEPALADFGISTYADHAGSGATAAYTPTHAPPEVLRGEPAQIPADIYNLASTLYQLLAGTAAFGHTGDTGLATFVDHVLNHEPPALGRTDVPAPVLVAILHGMAKDPADRPPSAEAFARELQAAQAAVGLPVTELLVADLPDPGTDTDEGPMGPPATAAAAVAGGAAAAAVAGGAAGAVLAGPAETGSGETITRPTTASTRTTTEPDAALVAATAPALASSGDTILPPSADLNAQTGPTTGDHTILGGRQDALPPPPVTPEPVQTEPSRKPLAIAAVIILLAAVITGGLWYSNRKSDDEKVATGATTTIIKKKDPDKAKRTTTTAATPSSTTATLPPVTETTIPLATTPRSPSATVAVAVARQAAALGRAAAKAPAGAAPARAADRPGVLPVAAVRPQPPPCLRPATCSPDPRARPPSG